MNKRDSTHRANRTGQQRSQLILLIIVILFALALTAFLVIPSLSPAQQAAQSSSTLPESQRPQTHGLSMGDPSAPVKVIEYSDFLCSHCREFATNLEPTFIKKYVSTGKVYYTYFPYPFLTDDSPAAAKAAYCANDQEKFWQYHDILFSNATEVAGSPYDEQHLETYAQNVGLNVSNFRTCMTTGKFNQKIQDDIAAVKQAGVKGTPTFSVNGTLVYQTTLVSTIEAQLNANGK